MSMDDSGVVLVGKPEKVSEAGGDIPPVKSFPKGDEDQRCPRCKAVPNSMISMADGEWMCTVCAYPDKDIRRDSDKRN